MEISDLPVAHREALEILRSKRNERNALRRGMDDAPAEISAEEFLAEKLNHVVDSLVEETNRETEEMLLTQFRQLTQEQKNAKRAELEGKK